MVTKKDGHIFSGNHRVVISNPINQRLCKARTRTEMSECRSRKLLKLLKRCVGLGNSLP